MGKRLSGRRVGFLLVVVALGGSLIVVAWLAAVGVAFEACDPEFGVAPDSPAGRFCRLPAGYGWGILGLAGPPIATIMLARAALRRRGWRRPLIASALVAGLLVVVGGVAIVLPDECSDADQQRSKTRSHGEQPPDCYSY